MNSSVLINIPIIKFVVSVICSLNVESVGTFF